MYRLAVILFVCIGCAQPNSGTRLILPEQDASLSAAAALSYRHIWLRERGMVTPPPAGLATSTSPAGDTADLHEIQRRLDRAQLELNTFKLGLSLGEPTIKTFDDGRARVLVELTNKNSEVVSCVLGGTFKSVGRVVEHAQGLVAQVLPQETKTVELETPVELPPYDAFVLASPACWINE